MVGRFWECVGLVLVVVGSVRRGLTSSRHSARKGTASTSSGTQALIVFCSRSVTTEEKLLEAVLLTKALQQNPQRQQLQQQPHQQQQRPQQRQQQQQQQQQ